MHVFSPDYCRRRLVQSQERAALATTPEARAIHDELAQRYAELLAMADGGPPVLRIVSRLG